jgi:hypothetical protein
MPAGRPTLYDPKYCDEIIAAASMGYSLTAFAGMIDVHRDTLYEWADKNPEFSDAMKRHKARRVFKLETDMLSAEATGPYVTARIFALKNACPEEWRDKHEVDHTSSDGSMTPPTRIELVAKHNDDRKD